MHLKVEMELSVLKCSNYKYIICQWNVTKIFLQYSYITSMHLFADISG